MASLWALQGNFDAALDEQDRILSAAPHCADNLAMLAGNLAFVAGDPQKAANLRAGRSATIPKSPGITECLADAVLSLASTRSA